MLNRKIVRLQEIIVEVLWERHGVSQPNLLRLAASCSSSGRRQQSALFGTLEPQQNPLRRRVGLSSPFLLPREDTCLKMQ